MYFSRPYASWQRETNENTNGLLCRFWPKASTLPPCSEQEIQDGLFVLNLTPRKVLNALTLLEVFTGRRVALIT